jgi:hypothetical protein
MIRNLLLHGINFVFLNFRIFVLFYRIYFLCILAVREAFCVFADHTPSENIEDNVSSRAPTGFFVEG